MEQMSEDRFATEGSVGRVSDYSVSSSGDPFRYDAQSPSFQKDIVFSSPPIHPCKDILVEDLRRQTANMYSDTNEKREVSWAYMLMSQVKFTITHLIHASFP